MGFLKNALKAPIGALTPMKKPPSRKVDPNMWGTSVGPVVPKIQPTTGAGGRRTQQTSVGAMLPQGPGMGRKR